MNCAQWVDRLSAGALLLTVNQRLARLYHERYQQACLARGRRCWETPSILPLSAWFGDMHAAAAARGLLDAACLPELLVRRLWRQAVEADGQSAPHGGLLLDSERVAEEASRSWQRAHEYALMPDIRAAAERSLSGDCRAFRRWAAHFEASCRRRGAVDPSRAADQVLDLIERNASALSLPAEILHAGFLLPDRRQQRLLSALAVAGVSLRALQPDRRATCERVAYDDDEAELMGVARSVRVAHEGNPAARLGVVIADLGARRSRVLRAFDRVFFPAMNPVQIIRMGRPYDLSLGVPLDRQPVVQTALDTVELLVHGLDNDRFSRWLLSPYLLAADDEAQQRRRLDRRLRSRRVRWLDGEALRAQLPGGSRLAEALHACAAFALQQAADHRRWSRQVGACLSIIDWPGRGLGSEEYQAVEAWRGCLDDLERFDEQEPASASRLLGELQYLTGSRIFQPETPAAPIAILGRLESHGIEFDRLWITGLDQEQWPPSGSPNPLLPVAAQRAAGVPEADAGSRLRRAEAEFELWSRSSGRLTASHALSRDGNTLLPAAIIAALPCASTQELPDAARVIAGHNRLESVLDAIGPPVAAGAGVLGGARLFEDQARCPFKAFATHRLGIRALEEAGPGLDARQHGTLLHAALEHFWTTVQTHAALQDLCARDALESALADAIDRALGDVRARWPLTADLEALERRRLMRLLHEWLERKELPRRPFTVLATESERTVCRADITVTLKVDRIDRLDSGETVVLDYKTGTRNRTSSWSTERIENPQLPLYALSDKTIAGVCFAQIAPHAHRFSGMAHEEGLIDGLRAAQDEIADWPAWRRHWASVLDALAAEIASGHASVSPIGQVCRFCELKAVCRVDPRAGVSADDEPPAGRAGSRSENSDA